MTECYTIDFCIKDRLRDYELTNILAYFTEIQMKYDKAMTPIIKEFFEKLIFKIEMLETTEVVGEPLV